MELPFCDIFYKKTCISHFRSSEINKINGDLEKNRNLLKGIFHTKGKSS